MFSVRALVSSGLVSNFAYGLQQIGNATLNFSRGVVEDVGIRLNGFASRPEVQSEFGNLVASVGGSNGVPVSFLPKRRLGFPMRIAIFGAETYYGLRAAYMTDVERLNTLKRSEESRALKIAIGQLYFNNFSSLRTDTKKNFLRILDHRNIAVLAKVLFPNLDAVKFYDQKEYERLLIILNEISDPMEPKEQCILAMRLARLIPSLDYPSKYIARDLLDRRKDLLFEAGYSSLSGLITNEYFKAVSKDQAMARG